MKSRMILPILPVLLAIVMFVGSKEAAAFDIGVSVGDGHRSHRYRDRGYVQYRTSDPVYSTWYPDTHTSYVYVPTRSYYSDGYYGNSYIYSTNSSNYNGWYGSGRSGRGGHYGDRRRR